MSGFISVSLEPDLRARLDEEASRQRRSRSFVVREAVRAYLAERDHDAFAAARDRTLREALALSPERRIALAEELWEELSWNQQPTVGWARSFETFEEYER